MLTWSKGKIDNSETVISSFIFEDKISHNYCLRITCHGSADAHLPAAFDVVTFNFQGQKISGMLFAVDRAEDKSKQRWNYVLDIRPRLHVLALRRSITLYPNASIHEIVISILASLRQSLGAKDLAYQSLITNGLLTTPFKRLEINYADNDLVYLQAIIQYGLRFCFEETDVGERILLVDAVHKLPRHRQALSFNPDKKEDVYQDAPSVYQRVQRKKWLPAQGCATFYDSLSVTKSLENIMHTTNTPNNMRISTHGEPLMWMSACYSPPAINKEMSSQVDQLLHSQDHVDELHSYYSGLRAGEQVVMDHIEGFIESVKLTGHYEHEQWRFDSVATFRRFKDKSWLGDFIKPKPLPATLTGAEIQGDDQVSDQGAFTVKFPERFLTEPHNNDPLVSCRDVQATTTSEGGVSHSMSGHAEVVIASQNGAAFDWMILGSLDNNERPSNIASDNYRLSRMNTSGGVNVHLHRQDSTNPYSELNMSMRDSQHNPAGINLGTNIGAMQNNSELHGIQEVSTGYGKRVSMNNWYETIGDIDNPIHQITLIQNADKKTSMNKQLNTSGSGVYAKSYFTKGAVKI